MHAQIVVSHPKTESLTVRVAKLILSSVQQAGHSAELVDLMTQGFDPRFQKADIETQFGEAPPPADVIQEQERIDRADALVLVYPVYWWSMPGLLKGWIDRVFANGWAFEVGDDSRIVKKLERLPIHLVALPGASQATYARHGYFDAMKTQIDRGIFGYCGAPVIHHELLFGIAEDARAERLEQARAIGQHLFDPMHHQIRRVS